MCLLFSPFDVQEMAVKLEEKRAESKRKGNKNDFSLSTTPRQDKKARLPPPMSFNRLHIVNPITGIIVCASQQQKKDTFSRKASAPDKLSISEHSPRQPRTRSVPNALCSPYL
jgi:hypothetical protein